MKLILKAYWFSSHIEQISWEHTSLSRPSYPLIKALGFWWEKRIWMPHVCTSPFLISFTLAWSWRSLLSSFSIQPISIFHFRALPSRILSPHNLCQWEFWYSLSTASISFAFIVHSNYVNPNCCTNAYVPSKTMNRFALVFVSHFVQLKFTITIFATD